MLSDEVEPKDSRAFDIKKILKQLEKEEGKDPNGLSVFGLIRNLTYTATQAFRNNYFTSEAFQAEVKKALDLRKDTTPSSIKENNIIAKLQTIQAKNLIKAVYEVTGYDISQKDVLEGLINSPNKYPFIPKSVPRDINDFIPYFEKKLDEGTVTYSDLRGLEQIKRQVEELPDKVSKKEEFSESAAINKVRGMIQNIKTATNSYLDNSRGNYDLDNKFIYGGARDIKLSNRELLELGIDLIDESRTPNNQFQKAFIKQELTKVFGTWRHDVIMERFKEELFREISDNPNDLSQNELKGALGFMKDIFTYTTGLNTTPVDTNKILYRISQSLVYNATKSLVLTARSGFGNIAQDFVGNKTDFVMRQQALRLSQTEEAMIRNKDIQKEINIEDAKNLGKQEYKDILDATEFALPYSENNNRLSETVADILTTIDNDTKIQKIKSLLKHPLDTAFQVNNQINTAEATQILSVNNAKSLAETLLIHQINKGDITDVSVKQAVETLNLEDRDYLTKFLTNPENVYIEKGIWKLQSKSNTPPQLQKVLDKVGSDLLYDMYNNYTKAGSLPRGTFSPDFFIRSFFQFSNRIFSISSDLNRLISRTNDPVSALIVLPFVSSIAVFSFLETLNGNDITEPEVWKSVAKYSAGSAYPLEALFLYNKISKLLHYAPQRVIRLFANDISKALGNGELLDKGFAIPSYDQRKNFVTDIVETVIPAVFVKILNKVGSSLQQDTIIDSLKVLLTTPTIVNQVLKTLDEDEDKKKKAKSNLSTYSN